MIYLLDISVLLAWLWDQHEHHTRVLAWESGKSIAICPLTELGFLRISTSLAFGATMEQAREMLAGLPSRDWTQMWRVQKSITKVRHEFALAKLTYATKFVP